MLGKLLGNMLVKPGQAPLFDSPENYGLTYENVEFQAKDGITLRGWLIPGDRDKVIIQNHFGTYCCRAGYTNEGKGIMKAYPEDIHFLRQVKYLNDAGYTVLAYDFRGHGESDNPTVGMITWGPEEAKDVVAAVDYIGSREEYKHAAIGLLSICMGQGASVAAYGREELGTRKQVKAMIAVQPLDFGTFLNAMGVPKFLQKGTVRYLKKVTGIDYIQATWRQYVKNISVPTLVIQNKNDGYLNQEFVDGVYTDISTEKEMYWIEIPKKKGGANPNRLAAYNWLGDNPEKILEWFGKYVKS